MTNVNLLENANLRIKKLNKLKDIIKKSIKILMDPAYNEFLIETNNYKELESRHYEVSKYYARLIEIKNEIKHIENYVLNTAE